jgi:fucose permease
MTCLAIAVNFAPVYLTTFSETFGGAAGLTEEQLGRIPAIIFAATVTGILATGRLADLWGGKLFTLLGLGLTAAGLCMLAAAGSYATLLAAGAVMGFGGGVLDMVLSPIVCAMRPNAKPRMLNWLHAFYCIGALGTVLAASAALRLHISWRALALGMNIVPVAMFIAFLPLRIPPLVHEDADRTPLAALVSRPFFLAVLLAITFCGATEQGMAQWLPAYAERSLGYTKAFGAMALAGFSIGMIIGRTLAGGLAHRFAPRPILLAGCAGCVACYAIACFFPERTVALAACIATGFAVSSLWPTMLGLASDRFPHGGASMFSLMAAGGNIGCFLMPWIIGILARYLPLPLSIASAALCPLFLAVILIAAKTRK